MLIIDHILVQALIPEADFIRNIKRSLLRSTSLILDLVQNRAVAPIPKITAEPGLTSANHVTNANHDHAANPNRNHAANPNRNHAANPNRNRAANPNRNHAANPNPNHVENLDVTVTVTVTEDTVVTHYHGVVKIAEEITEDGMMLVVDVI